MKLNPKPATRMGQTMRTAIFGLSGSGKTLYALEVANILTDGHMERVLVIDTENESSGLYSGRYPFMIQPWEGPHNPETLADLIAQADQSPDIDVIIVDGMSPFWDGTGGMLDIVEQEARKALTKTGKANSFAGWGRAGDLENELKAQILDTKKHLIVTLRGKNFTPDDSDAGLTNIKVKPIQRDSVFYEFSTAVYIHKNHSSIIVKSRCEEIREGQEFPAEGGAKLYAQTELDWLNGNSSYITAEQAKMLKDSFALIPAEDESGNGLTKRRAAKDRFLAEFGAPDKLNADQLEDAVTFVKNLIEEFTASDPFLDDDESADPYEVQDRDNRIK